MDKKKVTTFVFLGLVFLGIVFTPGYLKIRSLLKQNRDLERQIREVIQANIRLAGEQERLKNDPVYLEKVARQKLGIAKEGEIVYQVLPPEEE